MLRFDVFAKKLDELNGKGTFRGFVPRWILPTKVRRPDEPARNTSCLLIVIDSKREVDLNLTRHFSQQILGENEIMVSAGALRHLGVSARNKEKVEVYFDISGLLTTLSSMKSMTSADAGSSSGGSTIVSSTQSSDQLQAQLNSSMSGLIAQLLPSRDELLRILRDDANLPINDQNEVEIDLSQIINQTVNFTDYNFTIPTPLDLDRFE